MNPAKNSYNIFMIKFLLKLNDQKPTFYQIFRGLGKGEN